MTIGDIEPKAGKPVGGRKARTDVARAMILAALLSVFLVGVFVFFESRAFLTREVEGLLQDIGAARASRIERGIENVTKLTEALAVTPSVGEALVALSIAFDDTSETLSSDQQAELESFYRERVAGSRLPGLDEPVPDDVFPVSERTQYLQYWYIAANPFDDRADLIDPGDGSPYSEEHARYHPIIRKLTSDSSVSDVIFADLDGDIVYTIAKRVDFATNLLSDVYRSSILAETVIDLQASAAGEAALVDFSPYTAAGGELEMWVVSLVRNGDRIVGAVAAAIPADVLTDVTSAFGDWEGTGLGRTGEVYIVGSDGRLRSESRLWLEEPEQYLEALADAGYPPEIAEDVSTFGTTVLIQPVDTDPVAAAQQGERFVGASENYLNRSTVSIAEALKPISLGWVVVTEAETSELNAPLFDYLARLAIAAVVIVVVVVAVAFVSASRLLRPIDPIVEAANKVSLGDLDVRLPDAGRDEFAYLSGQFNEFVDELTRRRAEVLATEAETSELLASVVPRRLVDKVMAGDRDIAESMSNASLIAFTFKGATDGLKNLEDLAEQNTELINGISALAERYGAEQLSSSAVTVLYATGLDVDDPRIEEAVEFAAQASDWLSETLRARGFLIDASVGIASGDLVTGVMGTERLTVDVLGAPRQVAGVLSGIADPRQVLVDAEVAGRLGDTWQVERVADLKDLSGTPIDAWKVTRSLV